MRQCRRMWGVYSVHFCTLRHPYPSFWMFVMKFHSYYQRCKTENCWHKITCHIQHGVGAMSLYLFAINAANTLFMTGIYLSPPQTTQHSQWELVDFGFIFILRMWLCMYVYLMRSFRWPIHQNALWLTNVNISVLTVPYLNATITVQPETRKHKFNPTYWAKQDMNCWLMRKCLGLALKSQLVGVLGESGNEPTGFWVKNLDRWQNTQTRC
jgi:hypothetical protein